MVVGWGEGQEEKKKAADYYWPAAVRKQREFFFGGGRGGGQDGTLSHSICRFLRKKERQKIVCVWVWVCLSEREKGWAGNGMAVPRSCRIRSCCAPVFLF